METFNSLSGASNDSGDTSNSFRYLSGISVSAGFYQRPLPFLGVALEAGYRFPVSYKYHELGEENSLVVESGLLVQKKDKFEFKGGLELLASSSLTFSGGFVLSFDGKDETKTDHDDDGPDTESQDTVLMALTLGATYRVNESMLVTTTLGIIRGHSEIENFLEIDLTRVDMLVGVVYNY